MWMEAFAFLHGQQKTFLFGVTSVLPSPPAPSLFLKRPPTLKGILLEWGKQGSASAATFMPVNKHSTKKCLIKNMGIAFKRGLDNLMEDNCLTGY